MKKPIDNKAQKLASLLTDYPELSYGLDQLLTDDQDQVVSLVGVYSLLQLRLRAVLKQLPQMAPQPEEEQPGESA